MHKKIALSVPINRVEGDLRVRVELEDGHVSNAWCSGVMFRGFERILAGRGALDGLVITPRICGICGVAHLTAAVRALDMATGIQVPPNAVRLRNVCLMVEHIQSDMRHGFLMFTADFVNPAYRKQDWYPEAVRRYTPFKGETVLQVIQETRRILELVAIIGGQWPHSAFMVPGGIASVPSAADLRQCRLLLKQYREWYERRILGCSIDEWRRIESADALDAWLEKGDHHRESDLGFFIRYARAIGLNTIGRGHGHYLSYGYLDLPANTAVKGHGEDGTLIPSGFATGKKLAKFDQAKISEHVAHSWFVDYEGGKHPYEGITEPYATGEEGHKYSWAKAPRYQDLPAETGPLAEMIVSHNPLFTNLVESAGASAFVRELARLVRPAMLIPAMETWLAETEGDGVFYAPPGELTDGEGYGLTHAARGALGHWVRIAKGRIEHYQIITPTAWHASPRDSGAVRGPTEEALIGTPVADTGNPVALGHVIRSFDHCLVCTVHAVSGGRSLGPMPLDP